MSCQVAVVVVREVDMMTGGVDKNAGVGGRSGGEEGEVS